MIAIFLSWKNRLRGIKETRKKNDFRLRLKGKAELSDRWSDVPEGGNSAFRFFTVEVELP
jgi:hypothetical protein